MKKAVKHMAFALALCALVCATLGCGSASSDAAYAKSTGAYYADSYAAAEAGVYDYATDEVYYDESASAEESGSGLSGLDEASYVENDRKLIYTSYYTIETKQFDQSYNTIIAAIDTAGGFLSSENTYGAKPEVYGDAGRTAGLTLRIPVGSYDTFLSAVEGVGNITYKSRSTEDVTTSYYDNEARIELYETHYEKLMEYLKNATDMEDIVTIEKEMTEVLYTIDSLKGTKRHMDDRIAYCTVNITLEEVVEYTEISVAKESFGERVSDAFMKTVQGVWSFLQDFAIFFIAALPVLALLAIVFCVFFFPIRAIVLHGKKKKAAKAAAVPKTEDSVPKAEDVAPKVE